MTTAAELPLELTPGAMQTRLERRLPVGMVTFEEAPAGWLTKAGTPRKEQWRRYHYTPSPVESSKRTQLPSVTTICGAVIPKDGLPPWYEQHGIVGAVEAVRRGLIDLDTPDEEAVRAVRAAKLGGDGARDEAAGRGINLHQILQTYMESGRAPNPVDHPHEHRPYIKGLARWLVTVRPEPVAIEFLVCDPERRYAGRADLLARIGPKLTLVDLKTNPRGAIFESAHLQVKLLRQAEERYGDHLIDDELLVSLDAKGGYREMQSVASMTLAERALDFYVEVKNLCSECDSANRIYREVLEEIDGGTAR